MIIYKNTAIDFRDDVDRNKIADKVEELFLRILHRSLNPSEKRAIHNSMSFMEKIVRRSGVADDCGVMVEYVIPATSNRIDFLIAGEDETGNKNFIIVELKQWQDAQATESDGVVRTYLGKGINETTHPSYQASSYKEFLSDFNENVYDGDLHPYACAYLHNYTKKTPEPLHAEIYQDLVTTTPVFFKDDYEKLERFIHKYVGNGKGMEVLYEIDAGKIRPSKQLIDHVTKMFEGNQEFVLLDEQKVAFEKAYSFAKTKAQKAVYIIKGGPGTGKSVLSMNLLGKLLEERMNVVFVAPNAAFRSVIKDRLAQTHKRNRLKSLFKGSAVFHDEKPNTFAVLVVDEAHRLKDGTAYMYSGENQIEDIVKAANTSIFFIDEDQAIRPDDIGSVKEIKRVAEKFGATIDEIELEAQFRCAGAGGFINWMSDVLKLKNTANFDGWDTDEFEFKIFDDPNKMREAIKAKHDAGMNARILAGYAWKWTSLKEGNTDSQVDDVLIPEFDFSMPWNSRKVGSTWAIDEKGINQIGCVHTSQGLEFDYVGVIVGKDLKYDPERDQFYTDWHEYKDSTGKKGLKDDLETLNLYVRRIYRILMSRGMKGCYVYFMDKQVEEYVRRRMR